MLFPEFPILTSGQLLLRRITPVDAGRLYDNFSRDEVTEFFDLPTFQSIDEADQLVVEWEDRYQKKEAIRWAITFSDDPDRLIGTCGFHNFALEHARAEIGYELDPNYWQKGIMTTAVSRIIQFGFEQFNLNRIEAFIDPDNVASRRLLNKLALRSEGILRDYFFEKGRYVDGEIFALLRKETSF